MADNPNSIHFPGLNNLRFIAAMGVLIFHVELKKQLLGFKFHFMDQLINLGDVSVTLFFVLSGFLITYLLLAERKQTDTIAIKKFYTRRILRIWPLYYLILILGFFVLPNIAIFQIPTSGLVNTGDTIQLSLFFLLFANIGFIVYGNVAYIDQTWSVAVEEQFYLVWPFIIKIFKRILPALLFIIILFGLLRIFFTHLFYKAEIYHYFYWFFKYTRIDTMAIGGLFAYMLFNNYRRTLVLIYNIYVQIITVILLLILLFSGYPLPYIHQQVYALLFGIVIINAAANGRSLLSGKVKALDYFGKISYGIYMYHNIMVVLSLKLCAWYFNPSSTLFLITSYLVAIVLTLLISHLSYRYFERFFLSLKKKFTVVSSSS
jgi:peptidoglycan/LPS O-acetylase OafA/YrhL